MRLSRISPALALGLVVSLSAYKRDRCDGVFSEFIPGVTVAGFSLASSGLGYLSTNIAFGDCFGPTTPVSSASTTTPAPIGRSRWTSSRARSAFPPKDSTGLRSRTTTQAEA